MRYPVASFAITFLILLTLLAFLFFSFPNKNVLIPATVEIDSVMIEESFSQDKEIERAKNVVQEKADLPMAIERRHEKEKKLEKKEITKSDIKQKDSQKSKVEKITRSSDADSKDKVLVLYGPLPKIPDHLREEAFVSVAIARFYISKDGTSKVELIKPCSNPELNYLLLKSLAKWKFAVSSKESTQDIRVNFIVE